ncbi:MAG: adenylate/guanylate cyclase domain-containing protein [bacterium]
MRYQLKLILLFLALAVITNGTLMTVMYFNMKRIVFAEIQSKALSIAITAAALIDGEPHKKIKTHADETTEEYKTLWTQLRKVREANRRHDTHMEYVYTMTKSLDAPDELRFGVDAEDPDSPNVSHAGDIYEGEYERWDINHPFVENYFSEDKWGTWLTGYAPLKDRAGGTVAAIGVDLKASSIKGEINRILLIGLVSMGLSMALAIAISLLLSKWASKPLYKIKKTVEAIGKGDLEARINLNTPDEFGEVGAAINEMAAGLKEREQIKQTFSKYVSKQVADELLQNPYHIVLGGIRQEVTVLFSDIRGFTAWSELFSPEDVISQLNEYFSEMVNIIFKHDGTLLKYIGDGIMAMFGAPVRHSNDPLRAVKAALEMNEELANLNRRWHIEGRKPLKIGIGINTGEVIVGNVGDVRRMEYTAIGYNVNIAARMEKLTVKYDVPIIISENTMHYVKDQAVVNKIGAVEVKGSTRLVRVFEVIGLNGKRDYIQRDNSVELIGVRA